MKLKEKKKTCSEIIIFLRYYLWFFFFFFVCCDENTYDVTMRTENSDFFVVTNSEVHRNLKLFSEN